MDQKRSTPEDSLVALKDHGRIEVRLKEILDSRGMKQEYAGQSNWLPV